MTDARMEITVLTPADTDYTCSYGEIKNKPLHVLYVYVFKV